MVEKQFVPKYKELDFYSKQKRIALRNCGRINPERIEEYIWRQGYEALGKVLTSMDPDAVIEEVVTSGLRGRGGGGFPTGLKWKFAKQSPGAKKFVICNADEGDPGAFMDRSILEGDPHALIEGMIIAGYAMGADEGYIYVRAEYPLAIKRLRIAIEQAEALGLLGEDIFSSGFDFKLQIKEGAGAFVCGEETALMASIEGHRGMPRPRPPFPAQRGLWDKPSNINNVETFANVPQILLQGGEWFASIGTEKSKGTKVFALTGKIKNTGLVEVPMGIKLQEIIFEIGGGISSGKEFKAVQIGGPSGGCIPSELLDLPVDYDSLLEAGAMMGSGGLVVMDSETCMVDLARFFLNFTQSESCGKCTPCREGTKRMLEILTRITEGEGQPEDIDVLESLGNTIKQTSLCGLGQTAPNPVLSTLRYFRHEYDAHIKDRKCPAGACTNLLSYYIEDNCKGCTLCKKVCPVDAISGNVKEVHLIDQEICIQCGACFEACKFSAISKG
ncbi:MAG: NADH-quinone oxidoreductase subunit NuoF [Firmicutes bacterium]|nr:NADH-quinone oxidoreductase subunit NuoF [Bacillota bacterium]